MQLSMENVQVIFIFFLILWQFAAGAQTAKAHYPIICE